MRRLPIATSAETSDRTKGVLRLTMACNERCPFCNVPVEDYEVRTPSEAALLAELERFVASGEETLTVSGGEPTLYRARLLEVVRRARASGMRFVELQTNAILVDEAYAAELAEAGVTSAFVSLLSHVPALHDRLAGYEGAFAPCLRGIDALLDHGVRVTLNPVIAHDTQALVGDYVDFVAVRLPRVESISLSAVQPHGRARHHLELLPDYAVLAASVREARARAAVHGLRLLNPYCGLPLCVGWEDAPERSVEAIEASEARGASVGEAPPGIENRGDKAHGAPCLDCALRTRCGGAWHAYWSHRGGRGIAAPLPRHTPWTGSSSHVAVVEGRRDARGALDVKATREALRTGAPTTWLRLRALASGDGEAIAALGAADVALELEAGRLELRELLVELRALAQRVGDRAPQARVRLAARVELGASAREAMTLLRALDAGGVEEVVLAPPSERAAQLTSAALLELPRMRVGVAPG